MKPMAPDWPAQGLELRLTTGARVADQMADALARGPEAGLAVARTLTPEEVRLGLSFLTTVMEVAALSSRALAEVQVERNGGPVVRAGWH